MQAVSLTNLGCHVVYKCTTYEYKEKGPKGHNNSFEYIFRHIAKIKGGGWGGEGQAWLLHEIKCLVELIDSSSFSRSLFFFFFFSKL